MTTLKQRVTRDNVRIESTMTGPPSEDSFDADWYRVTLQRAGVS